MEYGLPITKNRLFEIFHSFFQKKLYNKKDWIRIHIRGQNRIRQKWSRRHGRS